MQNIRSQITPPCVYTNLGRLDSAVELEFPDLANQAWTGKISVKRRLGSELAPSELRHILAPTNIGRYFVAADTHSHTRCIDGRCVDGYRNSPALTARPLGPQVPGGTPTAALCRRIADWDSINNDRRSTLVEDISGMGSLVGNMGGHIDDQEERGRTGCGAIDRIPEILQRITSPDAQEQVRDLTHLLLGESYDRDETDAIIGRLVSLQGKARRYFMYDPKDGRFEYAAKAIAVLRNRGAVERLRGRHNEIALIINLVPNTTFHRDQFAFDNNNHIQMFNYDFWRTLQVARKLYPADETASPERPGRYKRLRTRYITARAMFAIGVAMVLTDGSLELVVRSSKK